MFSALLTYLAGLILLAGAAFTLLATIGVIRMPDLYTRMHAASKAGAVGGGLILIAVALVGQDASITFRVAIGVVFLLLTTPLAAHLLARASCYTGYRAGSGTDTDKIIEASESVSAPD